MFTLAAPLSLDQFFGCKMGLYAKVDRFQKLIAIIWMLCSLLYKLKFCGIALTFADSTGLGLLGAMESEDE
ncbi:MAG: hypothetical protein ACF8OB_04095 [Phycisphaeraceae bacterium JB051]